MNVEFAVATYRAIRDRLRGQDPEIDERTLADTVEGLTDLHQILEAIIRSALEDEALASGLKGRIGEMQERLARFEDRASKRRQIAKDVMVDLDLKKLQAPDFTASIRPGTPALWSSMRRPSPASTGSRATPASTGKVCWPTSNRAARSPVSACPIRNPC